jgi:hypothetical protein
MVVDLLDQMELDQDVAGEVSTLRRCESISRILLDRRVDRWLWYQPVLRALHYRALSNPNVFASRELCFE